MSVEVIATAFLHGGKMYSNMGKNPAVIDSLHHEGFCVVRRSINNAKSAERQVGDARVGSKCIHLHTVQVGKLACQWCGEMTLDNSKHLHYARSGSWPDCMALEAVLEYQNTRMLKTLTVSYVCNKCLQG